MELFTLFNFCTNMKLFILFDFCVPIWNSLFQLIYNSPPALRKTMLRAHQQAWVWQDEWWGLTIDDIRAIEQETMALLQQKYAQEDKDEDEEEEEEPSEGQEDSKRSSTSASPPVVEVTSEESPRVRMGSEDSEGARSSLSLRTALDLRPKSGGRGDWGGSSESIQDRLGNNRRTSWARSVSKNTLSSQSQGEGSCEIACKNILVLAITSKQPSLSKDY